MYNCVSCLSPLPHHYIVSVGLSHETFFINIFNEWKDNCLKGTTLPPYLFNHSSVVGHLGLQVFLHSIIPQ